MQKNKYNTIVIKNNNNIKINKIKLNKEIDNYNIKFIIYNTILIIKFLYICYLYRFDIFNKFLI